MRTFTRSTSNLSSLSTWSMILITFSQDSCQLAYKTLKKKKCSTTTKRKLQLKLSTNLTTNTRKLKRWKKDWKLWLNHSENIPKKKIKAWLWSNTKIIMTIWPKCFSEETSSPWQRLFLRIVAWSINSVSILLRITTLIKAYNGFKIKM